MDTATIDKTVGELVSEGSGRSRVFEEYGIDYCCGGKQSLAEACAKKGVDVGEVLRKITEADADAVQEDEVDYRNMAPEELADHIQATHHAYLTKELPRLVNMAGKVVEVHGAADSRLSELAQVVKGLSEELQSHMSKEEDILFPIIRQLAHADTLPLMHCGELANPIGVMQAEHDAVGGELESIHRLTDGYAPPEWACNTYRELLKGLHQLELDLHQHIHKENNILFPKALELEATLPD